MSNENVDVGRTYFWGSSPSEEEYHASHQVRGSKSLYTSPRGLTLFTRSWEPVASMPKGVVCMVHGYGNDISWTFQSTPIFLARHGFACFAVDLQGHGHSEGLRAFVPDVDLVVSDLVSYFGSIIALPRFHDLPRFLYGESMGGALCLLIHLQQQQMVWKGAVLVAPMCKISDSIRPSWPLQQMLKLLARFTPTLPVVPTADLVDISLKVLEKKMIARSNPSRYQGRPRLGTVAELLRVTDYLNCRLSEISLPFLVVHGSSDVVTDPSVSQTLFEAASSMDKTIKIYEGMMHSLVFGETDDNVNLVLHDILDWLNCRD